MTILRCASCDNPLTGAEAASGVCLACGSARVNVQPAELGRSAGIAIFSRSSCPVCGGPGPCIALLCLRTGSGQYLNARTIRYRWIDSPLLSCQTCFARVRSLEKTSWWLATVAGVTGLTVGLVCLVFAVVWLANPRPNEFGGSACLGFAVVIGVTTVCAAADNCVKWLQRRLARTPHLVPVVQVLTAQYLRATGQAKATVTLTTPRQASVNSLGVNDNSVTQLP
jgi:hypothetical protein